MKVDLCMWAKNGAKALPLVLRRIEQVIPSEAIAQRIFVDDHSTDDTVKIAKDFNWSIYENKSGFVSGGANEALSHVKTEFFVSVEQDLFLAKEWWDKIPKHMENPRVVVAQGIRLPTLPALRVISSSGGKHIHSFSIDNNIYKTAFLRALGGFPKHEPISVDRALFRKVASTNYIWVIDTTVTSAHIKLALKESYSSQRLLLTRTRQLLDQASLFKVVRSFFASPFRALQMSLKAHEASVLWAYPWIRLLTIRSFIQRRNLLKVLKLEPDEVPRLIEEAVEQSRFPNPRLVAQKYVKTNRILDVGCGKGNYWHGQNVVGLDLWKPYLIKAKRSVEDVVLCDVRRIPIRPKSCESVVCIEVLEHLRKMEGVQLLKDLDLLAKREVILTTPVVILPQGQLEGNPYQQHQSVWRLSELENHGFRLKEKFNFPPEIVCVKKELVDRNYA